MHQFYLSETLSHFQVPEYRTKAAPGIVWVEMCPEDEGAILLPGDVKTKTRRDYAKVVAVGGRYDGHYDGRSVDPSLELSVGDLVVVDYRYGKWLKDFGWESSFTNGQTRIYGCNGGVGSHEEFCRYPFSEGVPLKVEGSMIKALDNRVLLRVTLNDETAGGILMLREKSDPVATVESVGINVKDVKVGDKVVFHVNNAQGFDGMEEARDLVLVTEDSLYGLYEG